MDAREQRKTQFKTFVSQCWQRWNSVAGDPKRDCKRKVAWKRTAYRCKPLGYSENRVKECLAAMLCQAQLNIYEAETNKKPPTILARDYLQVESELRMAGISVNELIDMFRASEERPHTEYLFEPDAE